MNAIHNVFFDVLAFFNVIYIIFSPSILFVLSIKMRSFFIERAWDWPK